MATPKTIQQIIDIAKISQYISANNIANGALFGARKIPTNPRIIYMENAALQWMYANDPTNSSLRLVANYVYSLCIGNLQAQAIAGSGGSISPITPSQPRPDPIYFIVSSSSIIPTGGSSVVLPQFIGWNIVLARDGVAQMGIDNGGMYFTWDRTTGLLNIFGAANVDEYISITPA